MGCICVRVDVTSAPCQVSRVRCKQIVRDKLGQLEDNAGIITQGCLGADELNMHFSSVFTREDTSSLPVPETQFNGSEEEMLGQLIVPQK